jgi:hypothetical protein
MTREQKIKALAAVRDGRLKPSDLLPPVNYVVYHDDDGYKYNDEIITQEQYRELCANYKAETARREMAGLPVGYFINVTYGNRKKVTG